MALKISEKDFVFTWRIENFSMNALLINEHIKSPILMVNRWKKVKLQLFFYPRGWENDEFLSAYVSIIDYDQELETTPIEFSFSVIGSDTSTISTDVQKYIFGEESTYIKLAFRDKIFNEKNVYLPNDVLTIRFHMCLINQPLHFMPEGEMFQGVVNEDILPDELLMSNARYEQEEFKRHFNLTECSAVTHIIVKRKSVMWPIEGVRSLGPNVRRSIPIISALADNRSFVLTFYFIKETDAEDPSIKIEIRRMESNSTELVFVKCKITALNSEKDVKFHSSGEYLFKCCMKDDVWNFPFPIPKSRLEKLLHLANNILYLRCDLAYSGEGDIHHIGNEEVMPPECAIPSDLKSFNTLGDSFKDVYKTGVLSDVTLCVGNRSFKAHKIILSTRSPVFEAMFKNNMKEKDTGLVDITDLEADTLDQMLAFLYSDKLDVTRPEEAAELFIAADKYQVLGLKRRCSLFLQSVLSVSNVCLILNLAYMHQDDDLMSSAKDFVFRNRNELLVSECWKIFMESNLRLCANIMYDLLTGKHSL